MKKLRYIFLLSIAGMINAQDDEDLKEAKTSAYQAIIKKYELGLENHDLFEELNEIGRKSSALKDDLLLEVDRCSQLGNCEKSEKLEQLFKEFSAISLEFHHKENQLINSDASKQIREIFKQYAQ